MITWLWIGVYSNEQFLQTLFDKFSRKKILNNWKHLGGMNGTLGKIATDQNYEMI